MWFIWTHCMMGMMAFITITPTLWDYSEKRAFWVICSVLGDQWQCQSCRDQINLREWDIKDWQQDVWEHLIHFQMLHIQCFLRWVIDFEEHESVFIITLFWMSLLLHSFLQFMSSARSPFTEPFRLYSNHHYYLLSIQLWLSFLF